MTRNFDYKKKTMIYTLKEFYEIVKLENDDL
jgi:hypothetical protein